MHDRTVARTRFDRLHELRLREIRRDIEVLVFDGPFFRNRERFLHLEHDVRLADRPAFGVLRLLGKVLRIPLRGAAGDPVEEGFLLSVAQLAFVFERTRGRVGVPRRHMPFADFVPDRLCIRAGVVIRQKRHRRDFAGTMTARAVFVEDGCDVFREGRHRGGGTLLAGGGDRRDERGGKNSRNARGKAGNDRRLDAHGRRL